MEDERKVVYIDVSNMTECEICKLLNIEYVPRYKSILLWSLVLLFAVPNIVTLFALTSSH